MTSMTPTPIREAGGDGTPLWLLMHRVYGIDMEMGDGYSRCLAYLYRMALELGAIKSAPDAEGKMKIRKFDDDRKEKLRSLLTPEQERTFYILWNWWKACSAQCISIDYEELFGGPLDEEEDSDPEAQFYPNTHQVHDETHKAGGVTYELEFESIFNKVFRTLFNAELGNFVQARTGEHLVALRADCARRAACLHVALECQYSGGNKRKHSPEYVDDHLAHRSKQAQHSRTGEKRILGVGDLPGLDPRCITGSSVVSCQWLVDTAGLPYYLWDVKRRKTVGVTETLGGYIEEVPYTAISHTWGRWRDRKKPGKNLKPMVPWLIPQNSLFDVEDLPDILARVPTDTPYVWFDLVCIPQEGCGEELDERMIDILRHEIASQAAIFKCAKHAIAWWNTEAAPETWDGMQCAIQWMSSLYLDWGFSNERPVPIPTEEEVAARPTGMFALDETRGLLPWFSSLWTLQEVCLRPDIWLCNKDWDLLTIGDGTLVALNTIIALAEDATSTLYDHFGDATVPAESLPATWHGRYHTGFLELLELFTRTGMVELHQLKREHILLLATSRHCSHSRAQAIMSVLGMTKWYNPESFKEQRQPNKPGFIFDQYPLAFVQEVAANLGSNFFTSILTQPPVEGEGRHLHARGTMLPFRANISEEKSLFISGLNALDHASVSTWTVQNDGKVCLQDVEILFSSDSDPSTFRYMKTSFHLSRTIPRDIVDEERLQLQGETYYGDLRHWVKKVIPKIYGEGQYYAIHLRYRPGGCDGLLLKTLEQTPGLLFKIGNFHVLTMVGNQEYLPRFPIRRVNWLVL